MKPKHHDLIVWQRALKLSFLIYDLTKNFPRDEIFGLVSQMRRCAVSVPSNIAEGSERKTLGEFKQFLGIAKGSCAELETQILISKHACYISQETSEKLLIEIYEILKMIGGLSAKL